MSEILYRESSYNKAIKELGEDHICNQGCGEGHCWTNTQRHVMKLALRAAEIEKASASQGCGKEAITALDI